MSKIVVDVVAQTDIGLVRKRNEDVFLIADLTARKQHDAKKAVALPVGKSGLIFSVFDGMGGESAGDRASRLAAEKFFGGLVKAPPSASSHDLAQAMVEAIREANRRVHELGKSDRELRGMGTTLTSAGLVDENLVLAHVGDSRAYLLRSGAFVQITEDQSLAHELVAKGVISAADASRFQGKNVIMQALGVAPDVVPFAAEVRLQRGDILLLCTDGLTNMVPSAEILEVLTRQGNDLATAANTLTSLARANGGTDNITLVLAHFGGPGLLDPRAIQVRPISASKEVPPLRLRRMSPLLAFLLAVLLLLMSINVAILLMKG